MEFLTSVYQVSFSGDWMSVLMIKRQKKKVFIDRYVSKLYLRNNLVNVVSHLILIRCEHACMWDDWIESDYLSRQPHHMHFYHLIFHLFNST